MVNGINFGLLPLHYPLFSILMVLLPFLGFIWSLDSTQFFIAYYFKISINYYFKYIIHLLFTFFPLYVSILFLKGFLKGELDNFRAIVFNWVDLGFSDLVVDIVLKIDPLSMSMVFVVSFISILVQIYSLDYMSHDPNLARFMSYLSLFTFFMLVLVTSNNLLQLYLGWEGVGLVSFLLVNFWHMRTQAVKSAIKALLVNRVGDFFLILAISLIYLKFHTLDHDLIKFYISLLGSENINFLGFEVNYLDLIAILLFLAAVGKSSQLGLHTWLPDAMEGPTPVSALIHAATMVTAGVYLIIRFSYLFEHADFARLVLVYVGAITALFGASVGLFQNDIKRVIAYSTCSQLGYMVFTCGLSNYNLAMFHLLNHAFFKALLFLSAGVVIHALNGEQDMRRMGGLTRLLPFTYICILISSLSLMGFPFLTGFYSKDPILASAFVLGTKESLFAYFLGLFAALLTSAYSAKLIYLTFFSQPNGFRQIYLTIHEGPYLMSVSQFLLLIGSICFGYFMSDALIGVGTDFWNRSIFTSYQNGALIIASEFLPNWLKLLPVYLSLLVFFLVISIYSYKNLFLDLKIFNIFSNFGVYFVYFYTFFSKRWFFDLIYNQFLIKPILVFSYLVSYRSIDRGLLEWFGPYGLVKLNSYFSNHISLIQNGRLYDYFAWLLLSISNLIYFYWMVWFYFYPTTRFGDWWCIYTFWVYSFLGV